MKPFVVPWIVFEKNKDRSWRYSAVFLYMERLYKSWLSMKIISIAAGNSKGYSHTLGRKSIRNCQKSGIYTLEFTPEQTLIAEQLTFNKRSEAVRVAKDWDTNRYKVRNHSFTFDIKYLLVENRPLAKDLYGLENLIGLNIPDAWKINRTKSLKGIKSPIWHTTTHVSPITKNLYQW